MTARPASCAGYAAERVASTVVLIRDEGMVIGADPCITTSRRQILDPTARPGVDPATLSDAMLGHHTDGN